MTTKVSIKDLRVGTLVRLYSGSKCETVIDIYDDEVFHTFAEDGTVMQCNVSDVTSVEGVIDITDGLELIKTKLRMHMHQN